MPRILFLALEQLVFSGAGGWCSSEHRFWERSRGRELRGNTVARVWKCFPWRCTRSQETNTRLKLSLLLWFRIKIHLREEQSRAGLGMGIPSNSPGSPLQPGVNKPLFSSVSQPFNYLYSDSFPNRGGSWQSSQMWNSLVCHSPFFWQIWPFLLPLCHLQRCRGESRAEPSRVAQAESSRNVLLAPWLAAGH